MPKISAESVAAHVARQETHVFDAALRLFVERGYAMVTLGDIAAEVGLARNSLYRYFPSKAHILLRWFRSELPAQAQRSAELLAEAGTPEQRVLHWVDEQLDYAIRPEHALIAALGEVIPDLDAATRAELLGSHDLLLIPLRSTLQQAGVTAGDLDAVVGLIGGIVLTAAQWENRNGIDLVIRAQVAKAVSALVGSPPTSP
ncbi:MAG: helix-turn-helix domain-containing protein [Ilumatobacteraceae bacterium]